MNILLILSKNIINVIIEYCESIKNNIPNSKIIYYPSDEIAHINNNDLYIFFGLHYVNYPIISKKNVYYVNLEQLTIDGTHSQYNFLNNVLNEYNKKKINICDYSLGNIYILNKHNIPGYYLPYQLNNNEILNYEKIYNFAVCCSWNTRIEYIYNSIASKFSNCFSIGNPCKFGDDRDNILFRTKVLANIHHREFDYNILEEIRITRCILNKVIVVSEYSLKWEDYPLAKYVIFTDYNNMSEKICNVLDNYQNYYDRIYNDFDYNNINIELQKYLNFFINDCTK